MPRKNVFGALRATSIAALCAGAGLTLAGCEKQMHEDGAPHPAPKAAGMKDAAAPKKDALQDAEKTGGENSCAGDHKCAPGQCGVKPSPDKK